MTFPEGDVMKRIYYGLYLCTFAICMMFLFACAGKPPIVDETTLVSSNPRLQVKVLDPYRYVGKTRFDCFSSTTEHRFKSGQIHITNDAYIFLPTKLEIDHITKGIYVTIATVEPFFRFNAPFYNIDANDVLDHGTKDLGGESYQYVISLYCFDSHNQVTRFVNQAGMLLPEYCLGITLARVVDVKGRESITYFEDISPTGLDCRHWSDRKKLSDDQKKYIATFEQRALSSFQITRP